MHSFWLCKQKKIDLTIKTTVHPMKHTKDHGIHDDDSDHPLHELTFGFVVHRQSVTLLLSICVLTFRRHFRDDPEIATQVIKLKTERLFGDATAAGGGEEIHMESKCSFHLDKDADEKALGEKKQTNQLAQWITNKTI